MAIGSCREQYELRDFSIVRNLRKVTGGQLCGVRVHAIGHECPRRSNIAPPGPKLLRKSTHWDHLHPEFGVLPSSSALFHQINSVACRLLYEALCRGWESAPAMRPAKNDIALKSSLGASGLRSKSELFVRVTPGSSPSSPDSTIRGTGPK